MGQEPIQRSPKQSAMKTKLAFIICLLVIVQLAPGQIDTTFIKQRIGFSEYLEIVAAHNLGYAAELYNIDISEAAVEKARVFNDPAFSIDWEGVNENGIRTGNGFSAELATTIGMGGKRRARINLALSERDLVKSLVQDYFRNLQADAALAWLDALKQSHLERVKIGSFQSMKSLSEADSIRFQLGIIMEIDAIQSKVESRMLLNELFEVDASLTNSLSRLSLLAGIRLVDSVYYPSGNLDIADRTFSLGELITTAQNNRADLIAALNNKEVSQRILRLVKKERMIDLDVWAGLGYSYLSPGGSVASNAITAGISVPLKLSALNKGEINIARLQIDQAEELYRQAELIVNTEIVIAMKQYENYCKQVGSFKDGLLEEAGSVLSGKIYSYERGETSLLEVLNSQRTFNEIQAAYYETLYNRAASLVELQRAAGIWDLQF
jgi:outer membrane protein, heavy metal efflux system